ncbi:Hypothetical protein, putative [Bodo saltans]|uniref:Uncharacterized protein n=1 Tax=Bodo saltans TaxID=75058 RepID=A0A0S4JVV4_BODSA|nr:Hypothetical protein, putative [Bodo saltans]|eukprot:CUG92694.1 Hypothetical protein, putative [Bodo saltans]
MSFSSPQPQILNVQPTPRSVGLPPAELHGNAPLTSSSPPPATQYLTMPHPAASPGGGGGGSGGVTRHHVWTIGTSKRNTKSALRSSALARHQQQLQDGRSPEGLGDATAADNSMSFDQQVHYGVAGYRADGGGVSFYRTSVHRKDPQNIVLSHGVMTRVVDLNRMSMSPPPMSAKQHSRTLSGGSIGDDASTTPPPPMLSRYDPHQTVALSPWSPRGDDGTFSLEEGRSGGGDHLRTSHRSRSPGGGSKPRWNTSARVPSATRGGSPPPALEEKRTTAPLPRTRASSQGPTATTARESRGGVSPQAIRSALASGGTSRLSGAPVSAPSDPQGAPPPRAASVSKVTVSSPPRTHHLQSSSGSPPGLAMWQRNAGGGGGGGGGGLSSRASNSSIPNAYHPHHHSVSMSQQLTTHSTTGGGGGAGAAAGGNRSASSHDCRDSRCLHSRGDIVEVIAAKSQVRAMESHLLHEEIRREQLASALSSERERTLQLSQSLARAETSLQASQQQLVDGEHWLDEYQRRHAEANALAANVEVLEATVARHQATIDQQRTVIQRLENTVLEQSRELDEWNIRYRTLSNQLAEMQHHQQQVLQQQAQQQQQQQHHHHTVSTLASSSSQHHHHPSSSSRPSSPHHPHHINNLQQRHVPLTSSSADLEAVRQRVASLEAELDKARDEKTADERLRKELLRALSDKERQLVSHGITAGSGATSSRATPLAPTHNSLGPTSFYMQHGATSHDQHLHSTPKLASPLPAPYSPSSAPQPQSAGGSSRAALESIATVGVSSYRTSTVTTETVERSSHSGSDRGVAPTTSTRVGARSAASTGGGGEPPAALNSTAPRHPNHDPDTTIISNETPTDSMMLLDVTGGSAGGDNDDDDISGDGIPAPPLLARTSVSHRLF